jgi:hypothetical protein
LAPRNQKGLGDDLLGVLGITPPGIRAETVEAVLVELVEARLAAR